MRFPLDKSHNLKLIFIKTLGNLDINAVCNQLSGMVGGENLAAALKNAYMNLISYAFDSIGPNAISKMASNAEIDTLKSLLKTFKDLLYEAIKFISNNK